MSRIANPAVFRAEAVALDWNAIGRAQQGADRPGDASARTRVSWACHGALGVPHGVFTVWARTPKAVKLVPAQVAPTSWPGGTLLTWGTAAGRVVVSGTVNDVNTPVVVTLYWGAPTAESAVALISRNASGSISVDLRTGGATCASVTNLTSPTVAVQPLADIVNAPDWQPLELVGLPVGAALGDYDGAKQGLVSAPTDPTSAALDRLERGAPPFGWFPTVPSGVAAPPWADPDLDALVEVLRDQQVPRLAGLYAPGLPEREQRRVKNPTSVQAPGQAVVGPGPATTIDAAPWPMLVVPSQTDVYLNLAFGFGTAYATGASPIDIAGRIPPEYLVTATYADGPEVALDDGTVIGDGPAGEYAAYAPPVAHGATAAAVGLTAARYSLRPATHPAPPDGPGGPVLDGPWQENVRLSWPKPDAGAGWGRVTAQVYCRYPIGAAVADAGCAPNADYGGWRVGSLPDPDPNTHLVSVIDPYADIPLGSGGRHLGYGVAHNDIYGVWSPWTEFLLTTDEPAAAPPVVANPALTAAYTGAADACPAQLRVETMLEWQRRTTTGVQLTAVLYPMAGPTSVPPPGVGPGVAPAGCRALSWSYSFAGDQPSGSGCTVTQLDQGGYDSSGSPPVPIPPGPGQGEPRRFRTSVDLQLDFTATGRWGVVIWAQRSVGVGPTPTDWAASDPARWVMATAGSPVPVVPQVVILPGVPLGSMPDAAGRSHVRIAWGAPVPAGVKSWVIWSTTEQNLRDTLALGAAPNPVPGARLLELRGVLATRGPDAKAAFRRVTEVPEQPGSPREADVPLARGAADLQLFVVTSTTPTGTDSPFPTVGLDTQTQAFIAPHVVRPSPPLLRTAVTATGVDAHLEVASEVPVGVFRLYRTTVFGAARRADSMGAPTQVPAVALLDGGQPRVDAVSGAPLYGASTSLGVSAGWHPSYLRAVAVPDTSDVPERGVRGLLSRESDIVTVSTPPSGASDLAPLVLSDATPDHRVLVARTSTAAPDDTAWGPHRMAGAGSTITDDALAALATVPLAAVQLAGDGNLAPATLPAPGEAVLVRGPRSGGRTPLAVWFARADQTTAADVALRLVDPLGRAVVQRSTAPGVPLTPPPTLTLVDVTHPTPTTSVVTVETSVTATGIPPGTLAATARSRIILRPRLRVLHGSAALPEIPTSATATTSANAITFGWRRRRPFGVLWDVFVPSVAMTVTVTISDGAGRTATVSTQI